MFNIGGSSSFARRCSKAAASRVTVAKPLASSRLGPATMWSSLGVTWAVSLGKLPEPLERREQRVEGELGPLHRSQEHVDMVVVGAQQAYCAGTSQLQRAAAPRTFPRVHGQVHAGPEHYAHHRDVVSDDNCVDNARDRHIRRGLRVRRGQQIRSLQHLGHPRSSGITVCDRDGA